MLSTFPPTSCGIATFSAALTAGLIEAGAEVQVVRCGAPLELEDPLVVASLAGSSPAEIRFATNALAGSDVVIVQHEYGLYEGPDGASILDFMNDAEPPMVVVAHTVLTAPSANQRRVLEEVCALAEITVVMTQTARDRLIAGFDVDASRVVVIPHGAATPAANLQMVGSRGEHRRPRILTWGLLGPGKGIEWAIDAMDLLSDLDPSPSYVIAGATHPKVREHSGEAYREMLMERAAQTSADISFDDAYRNLEDLNVLIRSADIVLLPYDSAEQVTSGVLVDAVAAGRPVVSTAFPHAVELLATGAGIVVPQRDAGAIAGALRSMLADPSLVASMHDEAQRLAPDLSWSAVARRYIALGVDLVDQTTAAA